MNLENKTTEELLNLLPVAIEYEGKQYDLNISHGNRWQISYTHIDKDAITIDSDGPIFGKRYFLFKTAYSHSKIRQAILYCLNAMIENQNRLNYIPRIWTEKINE